MRDDVLFFFSKPGEQHLPPCTRYPRETFIRGEPPPLGPTMCAHVRVILCIVHDRDERSNNSADASRVITINIYYRYHYHPLRCRTTAIVCHQTESVISPPGPFIINIRSDNTMHYIRQKNMLQYVLCSFIATTSRHVPNRVRGLRTQVQRGWSSTYYNRACTSILSQLIYTSSRKNRFELQPLYEYRK